MIQMEEPSENKDLLFPIHSTHQFKLSKVDIYELEELVTQQCIVFVIMKSVPKKWLMKSDEFIIDIVLRNKVLLSCMTY